MDTIFVSIFRQAVFEKKECKRATRLMNKGKMTEKGR